MGNIITSSISWLFQPVIEFQPLLAEGIMDARIWWSIPLVVVISLVYGATRHEQLSEIIEESRKSAVWVIGFMLLIFAVIWFAGYWN